MEVCASSLSSHGGASASRSAATAASALSCARGVAHSREPWLGLCARDSWPGARETDALPCSLAVLEMQLRQLKSHLKKRGLKCDKCLQREWHAVSEELQRYCPLAPACTPAALPRVAAYRPRASWLALAHLPTHPSRLTPRGPAPPGTMSTSCSTSAICRSCELSYFRG